MNGLSLYVTTTRMLFQADIDDNGAWSDINRLMSYLRQSLTCCVCGHLLYVPMSSTVSSCQHHVCKSCVGGKMRLKPSCSWCKDHSKFIENIQLRILLQCYKQLTSFILSSPIADHWGHLTCEANQASYSSVPNNFNGPTTFKQLLEEGSDFHDKFTFSEPPPLRSFSRQANGHQISRQSQNHHHPQSQQPQTQQQQQQQSQLQAQLIQYQQQLDSEKELNEAKESLSFSSSSSAVNETLHKETRSSIIQPETTSAIVTTLKQERPINRIITSGSLATSSNQVNRKIRRGCRCGLATPNPGKLTCCGQRCPCYVENKPCHQCKCRGCRNPHKVSGLTTINIISSGSSSSSSPIISIPASNLFQIPILIGDEDEPREISENQVYVTTTNIGIGTEDETLGEEIRLQCSTGASTESEVHLL